MESALRKGSDMNIEEIDKVVREEAGADSGEGHLPCARALGIVRRLEIPPGDIGDAANRLNIRIIDCQLGCFGLKKAVPDENEIFSVPAALNDAILAALVDGRLPCSSAHEIVRKLETPPDNVGKTATRQQVKISSCQLGCFP